MSDLSQLVPSTQNPMPSPAENPQIAQLLAQLKGPALPDAIAQWPVAPGWWILYAVCLIAIVLVSWIVVSRYRKSAYRRQALARLDFLQNEENAQKFSYALAALLKQTFISASPASRSLVARLHGKNWQALLFDTCAVHKLPVEQQTALAEICGDAKYHPQFTLNKNTAIKACRFWIKNHKVKEKTLKDKLSLPISQEVANVSV